MEGAQAVAARSPALRAPQTWTRWTVESLEQTECGIPATSRSSSQHQPRRLRALHPDLNSEKEEEKRQAWPPGRHQELPCAECLAHILQNTKLFIQIFPCHSTRTTDGGFDAPRPRRMQRWAGKGRAGGSSGSPFRRRHTERAAGRVLIRPRLSAGTHLAVRPFGSSPETSPGSARHTKSTKPVSLGYPLREEIAD